MIEILILSLSLFISSGNIYYRKYEDYGILESQMETISPFQDPEHIPVRTDLNMFMS